MPLSMVDAYDELSSTVICLFSSRAVKLNCMSSLHMLFSTMHDASASIHIALEWTL